jgi:acyl carrier protein
VLAGGLGGLGLATAAHLAARGAGRIVLAGRNSPSEHVAARLEALRADGTRVEFVAVDLGRADSVRELVTRADTAEHPLRGIFNLAASFDDGILLNCDLARFAGVLAPKVEGSWNLHRCSEHLGLDHFVLFGSAAGLVGNAGQASYAAANAFLDGLAGHRRARGLPCTTIDWGAWEDVGATAGDDMRARLARQGVQTIDVDEGMEILDHLLVRGTERIAVLPLDGAPSGELARHPLLAGVTGAGASSQGPAPLADELRAASSARRGDLMVEHAQRVVGAVLGIPDDAPIDVRLGFFDLGMDSMMALEVRNRLAASLGIALPGTIALDHPTVDRLSEHLLELLFAGDEEAVATDEDLPGELADLLDEIEALSDADTQTRLR